jgi:hypothetical protein
MRNNGDDRGRGADPGVGGLSGDPAGLHLSQAAAIRALDAAHAKMMEAAEAVPVYRHGWRPSGLARSVVEILAHTAVVNMQYAAVFANEPMPFLDLHERDTAAKGCDTYAKAEALLSQTVMSLRHGIAALDARSMEEPVILPSGERSTAAYAVMAPALHMEFHAGQLWYLQSML